MQELASGNIREGQTIEIKNLQFKADSSTIDASSYESLNEVLAFIQNRSDIVIEIGGHTNNIPTDEYCDRLSTARAKSVAEYLVSKGADPTRIQFKGYGKNKPMADNTTKYGRSRNQRVEIKILSINKNGK